MQCGIPGFLLLLLGLNSSKMPQLASSGQAIVRYNTGQVCSQIDTWIEGFPEFAGPYGGRPAISAVTQHIVVQKLAVIVSRMSFS